MGRTLLTLALTLAPAAAFAQSNDDLFKGTWQVQSPDKGALVIILKNQGLASYFWGDNTDRNVYQGMWTATDGSATMTWNDGSAHSIVRTNSGFNATHTSADGSTLYESAAMQLPREVLGQWAKPPTIEDEMRSDRDQAKGYFGIWKFADSEDYLFVEADRSAATNIGPEGGQRGQWAKQGSELHIIWDSGHYSILSETERGYNYRQVESGKVIEEDESKPVNVSRTIESSVPSVWYTNYKAEREADTGGIAFSSRKVARAFYRGDWLVRRSSGKFEKIELARFGGLKTSTDRSLDGQWTLSGQDVFMRWDDGMRKILSPLGRGFVLYEYRPGRPLDGVPTRILPAAPADTAKLAEHLEGREEVAKQMRQMAEAAGIDPEAQEQAGWGRNFARWVWPFGNEDGSLSSEEMLEQEFAAEDNDDPWWWPFWSEQAAVRADADPAAEAPSESTKEKPAVANKETPAAVEMAEIETGDANEQQASDLSEEEESAESSVPKSRSAKDWLWPF